MQLTEEQFDALTEMMNIATGRAAASLSGLLHQHVKMRVLEIYNMGSVEMQAFLVGEVGEVGTVIEQKFSGGLDGSSLLVMTHGNAESLVNVLLQQNSELASLVNAEQTVLAEVGNIVLNACVSMFANQTGRRLHFSLPKVGLNVEGGKLARDISKSWEADTEGLVMKSHLMVGQTEVIVYVLLVLTMDSLTIEVLLREALKGLHNA